MGEVSNDEKIVPVYGSVEWNDYVMSMFTADELYDNNPNCNGLRRVARLLLGDIYFSAPVQVYPNGRGCVTVYEIRIKNWLFKGGDGFYTFGEVADSHDENTDEPYNLFLPAMSSTRAEARTLRKALAIKCVAAEELTQKKPQKVTDGEYNTEESISSAQLKMVGVKCKQMDIDVLALIQEMGFDAKKLTKGNGNDLVKRVNGIQQGKETGPKGYKENWESA